MCKTIGAGLIMIYIQCTLQNRKADIKLYKDQNNCTLDLVESLD